MNVVVSLLENKGENALCPAPHFSFRQKTRDVQLKPTSFVLIHSHLKGIVPLGILTLKPLLVKICQMFHLCSNAYQHMNLEHVSFWGTHPLK